jgi:hypothetical protein
MLRIFYCCFRIPIFTRVALSLSLLSKGVQTQAHIQYGPSEVSLNGASTQSCNYSASNLPYLTSISPAKPLSTCFNLILIVRGIGREAYFGFNFPDFFDGKCIPGRDRNLRGRTGLLWAMRSMKVMKKNGEGNEDHWQGAQQRLPSEPASN